MSISAIASDVQGGVPWASRAGDWEPTALVDTGFPMAIRAAEAHVPDSDALSDLLREQLGDMHGAIDAALNKQQTELDLTRAILKRLCDNRQAALEAVVRPLLGGSNSKHNKMATAWKASPRTWQRVESFERAQRREKSPLPTSNGKDLDKTASVSKGKDPENAKAIVDKQKEAKALPPSEVETPERTMTPSQMLQAELPKEAGSLAMRQLFQDMQRQQDEGHPMYLFIENLRGPGTAERVWHLLNHGCLPKWLKQPAKEVCEHALFKILVPVIILVNVVIVCISAHNFMNEAVTCFDTAACTRTDGRQSKATWELPVDIVFAVFFTFEIIIKLVAYELTFFLGPEWNWNLLDLVCALSSWSDVLLTTVLSTMPLGGNLALFRTLRALRLVKALRIVRVMRAFTGLRLLVLSVMSLFVPLLWAIIFMVMILLVFGITFQFGVAEFLLSSESSAIDAAITKSLIYMFRDLGAAILTLLKGITGGDDWTNMYTPLRYCGNVYGFLFIGYISLMAFGVLNIITGIFVETAMAKAKGDKNLAMADERQRNVEAMTQLVELFRDVDKSGDNKMSMEEWLEFSAKTEAAACLELLGLDVSRAREIFRLVDFDGSGEVEIEEFVVGCTELAGSAKVLDIESLMATMRTMLFKTFDRIDTLTQLLEGAGGIAASAQQRGPSRRPSRSQVIDEDIWNASLVGHHLSSEVQV